MVFAIVIAVLVALDLITGWMDARITNKGIKAGIGVEANEVITTLARTNKPSLTTLVLYNVAQMGVFLALGLFLKLHFPGQNLSYVATGGLPAFLAVDAAKHYQGFRQWAWMFRNPTKRIEDQTQTAWQKFVGFWG